MLTCLVTDRYQGGVLGSSGWRRLGNDEGEVEDDDLVEHGHEGGGEGRVLLVAHARRQVLGAREAHGEDVGEALRQRLLVQHVLSPPKEFDGVELSGELGELLNDVVHHHALLEPDQAKVLELHG